MSLKELEEKAIQLSPSDRRSLINTLVQSLQNEAITGGDRTDAINKMRGLLKTNQPAPTDQDVEEILERRRLEKFQV